MIRPRFHPYSMPPHGAAWGAAGVVLRARSRGPGVAVPVNWPRTGSPRRLLSGDATLRVGHKITLTSTLPRGREFFVVAEAG